VQSVAFSHQVPMDFPERLSTLRIARNLTQQQLADLVQAHITQIHRYEKGDSQPTLDVIRRLAVGLQVSADVLLFDQDVGNADDELRRQFEAIRQFDPKEREMAQGLIEALILKHQNKRFFLRENSAAQASEVVNRSKAAKARVHAQQAISTKTKKRVTQR